jgi:hypothetical protein
MMRVGQRFQCLHKFYRRPHAHDLVHLHVGSTLLVGRLRDRALQNGQWACLLKTRADMRREGCSDKALA